MVMSHIRNSLYNSVKIEAALIVNPFSCYDCFSIHLILLTLNTSYGNFNHVKNVDLCNKTIIGGIFLVNFKEEIVNTKVGNKLYFDYHRFFQMLAVWLACAIFSFFPLILRPLFDKTAYNLDLGYWQNIMSNNDILYLVVCLSTVSVGIAILFGKKSSVFVYFIAVLQVISLFFAMFGYLMLEGNGSLFGNNVYAINLWFLIGTCALGIVLFIAVSFRVRRGAEKL